MNDGEAIGFVTITEYDKAEERWHVTMVAGKGISKNIPPVFETFKLEAEATVLAGELCQMLREKLDYDDTVTKITRPDKKL